jgi:filamentous hemagglutinin
MTVGIAFVTDPFNRQLHADEKTAIADEANGDKTEEDRLTKAACYVVKCRAEFKPGSAEYNANYVREVEASQLGANLQRVNRQKGSGPIQLRADAEDC